VFHPSAGSHDPVEDQIDTLFADRGVHRRVMMTLAHGLGLAETIAATDLLICAPKRLADTYASHSGVVSAPLPFVPERYAISQFWHHRLHADTGHQWLRSLIFMHFASESPRATKEPEAAKEMTARSR
jgi:DNA-binding transcriptional LysR family regulator